MHAGCVLRFVTDAHDLSLSLSLCRKGAQASQIEATHTHTHSNDARGSKPETLGEKRKEKKEKAKEKAKAKAELFASAPLILSCVPHPEKCNTHTRKLHTSVSRSASYPESTHYISQRHHQLWRKLGLFAVNPSVWTSEDTSQVKVDVAPNLTSEGYGRPLYCTMNEKQSSVTVSCPTSSQKQQAKQDRRLQSGFGCSDAAKLHVQYSTLLYCTLPSLPPSLCQSALFSGCNLSELPLFNRRHDISQPCKS